MERPGLFERQRLQAVVEKGRLYASERPSICADLRQRIREAEIVPVETLERPFNVVPPSADRPSGRIEYNPSLVTRLAADHTYPEWVVSAQLEILIRAHAEEWHAASRQVRAAASDSHHSIAA